MSLAVEDTFRNFVREFGGEPVGDLLPSGDAPSNADFLFRKQNVVAELKCLENNSLGENYSQKMQRLTESWIQRRLLIVIGTVSLNLRKLPPICQREWAALIAEPLRRNVVKKADSQIRATKRWLGLQNAKGLLIVASDGNLALQPYDVAFFLNRILAKKTETGENQYSNVQGFFHFALNHFARAPGVPLPALFSHAGPRSADDLEMGPFCSQLQDAWYEFLCKLNGARIPVIPSNRDTIQGLKWAQTSRRGS